MQQLMWSPRSTPVTTAMLVINLIVFGITFALDTNINEYALVPAYLTVIPIRFAVTSFTSMFIHANPVHIIFNMLALVTLGRIVEPHIGSMRFLFVYVMSGLAGGGLHTLSAFVGGDIYTPVVGASGAISGIIGISAALGDRVAIFWIIAQVPFAIALAGTSPIAFFAHIGGFIFGFASGRIMLYIKRQREHSGGYSA